MTARASDTAWSGGGQGSGPGGGRAAVSTPRSYLPPEDVEGFVRFLVAFPLIDQAFIDSWFSAFDPAYRHTLADLPAVLPRLEAAFTRFNTDPPFDGSAIPLVIALEYLTANQANSLIVDRAKQLLSRIQISAPGEEPTVPVVWKELRLAGAGLFADRDSLRDKLIRMSGNDGPPAVIINGARDAGKTYTRKLVAHVSQKTLAFRFAWVEI